MAMRTRESASSANGRASPMKKPKIDLGAENKLTMGMSDVEMMDSFAEPSKQRGTLYDAVAGRLGTEGFLVDGPGKAMPPDQVLFRRGGAPLRYEEDDAYFAHRKLPPGVKLPNSDLLKVIHTYVSDFYSAGALSDALYNFESMDETALLAVGILLEEAAAHSLGKTGDLAFVEGERVSRRT